MDGRIRKLFQGIFVLHKRVSKAAYHNMSQYEKSISSSEGIGIGYSYNDAISKLNSLQSNAQVRAKLAAQRGSRNLESLPEMTLLLESIGITQRDLESLNTIHVAGTKGKGTTCAFTESILRHAGLRTGFFSSPHLVVVRERIRINGTPISTDKFAKHFFPVYNRLMSCKEKEPDFPMPPYFRFLTCMALYTFLEEKVDVAIIEVGIGGRYDCTNILTNPVCVGITSLGLEHQAILGQTLPEIAWNKAGIMKPRCPAFTVYNHPEPILKVLQDCASEVNCSLSVVPTTAELSEKVLLGVEGGIVSQLNASLSIQLSTSFLRQKFPEKLKSIPSTTTATDSCKQLSQFHITGLQSTKWPGRFQVMKVSQWLTCFLDGAHTTESLRVASEWFINSSHRDSFRVLIFNVTGERGSDLLRPLSETNVFDLAIFCPVRRREITPDSDNWNILSHGADESLVNTCKKHREVWNLGNSAAALALDSTDAAVDFVTGLSDETTKIQHLELCNAMRNENSSKLYKSVEVLVTGSLHLVGNMLSILDPSMNDE